MTVREYLDIIARRKWIIIITFAIVMAAAVALTLLTTPKYRASTTLRVLALSGSSSDLTYDTKQTDRLMRTYAETAISRPVLTELAEKLGMSEWPVVEVEPVVDTELMRITAETLDPVMAADAANALAEIVVARSQTLFIGSSKSALEILGEQLAKVKTELDQTWMDYEKVVAESPEDVDRISAASRAIELKETAYGALLEQYETNRVRDALMANTLSVLEPAIVPQKPATPRKELNLALGVVLGLLAGFGLAFLVESLDTTLHSADQIKKTAELPLLGRIPAGSRRDQPALFDGMSPQGEAFRRLRISLLSLEQDEALRTVQVTSAEPREGKSIVAANMAQALAQSGRRVMIVDAHLRLPTLHKVFDLTNRIGLSSVLSEQATVEEAIQRTNAPGIQVLTSGPLPANPAELLGSPQMKSLIEQLAKEFDMVLVDTPSLIAVTDAAAVSKSVDGVILVVELGRARQEYVRAARQQLVDVRAKPIGVVINRAEHDSTYDYYQRIPT